MLKERYWKEVAEIKQQDPGNVLLPHLEKGHTVVNELYLKQAWLTVHKRCTVEEIAPKAVQIVQKTIERDEYLNMLFRKKGHWNREQRKVRNNDLIPAKTDAERKKAMGKLKDLQEHWAIVQRAIRVFEDSGEKIPFEKVEMPEPAADAVVVIDFDIDKLSDFELSEKLNTASASVSRINKSIENHTRLDAQVLEKDHPKHAQYKKLEANLKKWSHIKTRLENEKKRRKNGEKTD